VDDDGPVVIGGVDAGPDNSRIMITETVEIDTVPHPLDVETGLLGTEAVPAAPTTCGRRRRG
jgi:hypothetical protein